MEFYIARLPVFNRKNEVFGCRLLLCPALKSYFHDQYREPDDAEALYRRLCFAGFDDTPAFAWPKAILEFSEDMFDSLVPLLPRKQLIVDFAHRAETHAPDMIKIKSQGCGAAFDVTIELNEDLLSMAELVAVDFSTLDIEKQRERIRAGKGRTHLLAYNVDTWDDFHVAAELGYDYFQGMFYTKILPGEPGGIHSLNTALLRVISELNQPAPSFREITNIIEHDLNLSYRVLKLVNSAYIAPRFQVKTISQAVTILGLNELTQFMSTLILRDAREARADGNRELLHSSLIRGKLMELLASQRKITQKGSEAFFTGIFSLIDVLLKREMADILAELPLTDAVKAALLGESCQLRALLDLVVDYEQARWERFSDGGYRFDLAEQQRLMNFYMSALRWAESLDL